jgi:hypothetical protein
VGIVKVPNSNDHGKESRRVLDLLLPFENFLLTINIEGLEKKPGCRGRVFSHPHQAWSSGRKPRTSRTFSSCQTASQSLRARALPITGAIRS